MLRLNLGCGSVCHPDWVNLDAIVTQPGVIACDLRKPLPFADSSADACYASHVLEHLDREGGRRFLQECARVLRVGGVVRIVVPDLENIATAYLKSLEGSAANHEWMVLELLDQLVRAFPGGEMHRLLTSENVANGEFIVDRVGLDAERLISGNAIFPVKRDWRHIIRRLREEAAATVAGIVLGREGKRALREGLFRRSGQVHLWMYDRVSLARLMMESGFSSPHVCEAHESGIPEFATSNFDVVGGRIRKPDSLFMEAVKP